MLWTKRTEASPVASEIMSYWNHFSPDLLKALMAYLDEPYFQSEGQVYNDAENVADRSKHRGDRLWREHQTASAADAPFANLRWRTPWAYDRERYQTYSSNGPRPGAWMSEEEIDRIMRWMQEQE